MAEIIGRTYFQLVPWRSCMSHPGSRSPARHSPATTTPCAFARVVIPKHSSSCSTSCAQVLTARDTFGGGTLQRWNKTMWDLHNYFVQSVVEGVREGAEGYQANRHCGHLRNASCLARRGIAQHQRMSCMAVYTIVPSFIMSFFLLLLEKEKTNFSQSFKPKK